MTFIYTPPPAAGSAVAPVFCQNVTRAQLQTLISTNGLLCNRLYTITDPFANPLGYGTITVLATSSSTISAYATWNKPANGVSIGGLVYTNDMTIGNTIDNIIVNGTNLLSGPIAFNTSLFQTMQDVATDINATLATSLGAIATPGGIILVDSIIQNTFNGMSPSSAVTGFTGAYGTYQLLYGEDPTNNAVNYPCIYDVKNEKLQTVFDFRYNNIISVGNASDDRIFAHAYNFTGITNCNFVNSCIPYIGFAVNNILINNNSFLNFQPINILYQGITITDNTVNNLDFSLSDGINFNLINSSLRYPINVPGIVQGTFNPVALFNKVDTDGNFYRCSGNIIFNGTAGAGQIGTPVFMQNSPNNFCFVGTPFLTNGSPIGATPLAEIAAQVTGTPNSIMLPTLASALVGTVANTGGFCDSLPFGQFQFIITVDDITAGNLSYTISGFLAP